MLSFFFESFREGKNGERLGTAPVTPVIFKLTH